MKVIVISIGNNLLAGGVIEYLSERGEMVPERILKHSESDEVYQVCRTLNADVLLMDISHLPFFTLKERLETARKVKKEVENCKIAILCDEEADPDLADKVKQSKKLGLIDGFFHSSVTGEYISAALDAL